VSKSKRIYQERTEPVGVVSVQLTRRTIDEIDRLAGMGGRAHWLRRLVVREMARLASERADLTQQPLGRNNALVWVCDGCANLHPRSGRYSFDDSASSRRCAPMATGYGGDGHRRKTERAK
jgi:uncharacterized metal-binding protein